MPPAATTGDARRLRRRAAGLLAAGWFAACAGPAAADGELRTVRVGNRSGEPLTLWTAVRDG